VRDAGGQTGAARGWAMLAEPAAIGQDGAVDFAAAGLLDGLQGERRQARVRLLERLVAQGYTVQELQRAAREQRLALLAVERALGGGISAQEIERRTGAPAQATLALRRLLGLPPADAEQPVFSEIDVEAARAARSFVEAGLSDAAVAEVTRVLGEAMARVAATTAAAFAESFLRPNDSEDQVSERFAALAEQLLPALGPVLSAAFAAHLRESVRQGMLGQAELESGQPAGAQQLAVCFADVVGFTRLGAQLAVAELGGVAQRFAELAAEAAVPPVRLVKTIGDAAMLVSAEPGALVGAALALIAAAESAELPSLRAGIALGSAVQRAGDFYGHSVNLASRVTGAARPGSVLCTQEVRDAAAEQYEWSFAGRFRFKGLQHPVPLHRARPARR